MCPSTPLASFSISMRLKNDKGFSLVEILLAAALLLLFFTAVTASFVYGLRGAAWGGDRIRAVFLAEEGLAAVQNIRDADFNSLSDGVFGLDSSGVQWAFRGSSDTIGNFLRQLRIVSVDATTKDVTSIITWSKSAVSTGTVALTTRLTNWLANTVSAWATPIQAGTYNASGSQDGWKVQVSGNYAYLVRNGGSPDFLIFDITIPTTPILVGSVNVGSTPTNLALSGNYAFVIGRNNSSELKIINIAVPSAPTVVGNYNAVGNADALGVDVFGDVVYLTRASSSDPEFLVINVANKSAPTILGSLNLDESGNEVTLSGSYAFVASSSNTQELQIVDITKSSAPTLASSYDFPGSTVNATAVAASGNMIYLGKGTAVFVFKQGTPPTAILQGFLDLTGAVNDLSLGAADTIFAATSNSTREFQVVDVAVPTSPVLLGYVDLTGVAANGIAYDEIRDQCAVAGENNAAELLLVTHP